MNKLKQLAAILVVPAILLLTACPGKDGQENGASESPSVDAITEESALEDADKILKEIEGL